MEIRKITPDEKFYLSRMSSIAFGFELKEDEMQEKLKNGKLTADNAYGAINEQGKLVAGMEVIPFTIWFDGQKVPMAGIGGVVSAPENRRGGSIRKLLEKAFADSRERDVVFSYLSPFSYDFYRKFGYEYSGKAARYTLPVSAVRTLKNTGSVVEFVKGDSGREEIVAAYEEMASRHNMMISRSQQNWDQILNITLFGKQWMYCWKNKQGIIRSWVIFGKADRVIKIHRISWADKESMMGILQFLGMFEGEANEMVLTAPPEFIPELIWNDPYKFTVENDWIGMSRVLDAEKALQGMRKPDWDGEVVVTVHDSFAEWNEGSYLVSFGGGDCRVKRTDAAPDIEVSERALAQLVTGVFDLDELALRDDVFIYGDRQKLKMIFPKKRVFIADHF